MEKAGKLIHIHTDDLRRQTLPTGIKIILREKFKVAWCFHDAVDVFLDVVVLNLYIYAHFPYFFLCISIFYMCYFN